jgi:hypothetical protein
LYRTPAFNTALQQLSYDYGCTPEAFMTERNSAFPAVNSPYRRKITAAPPAFTIAAFGKGAVIAASERLLPFAYDIIERFPYGAENIFSSPCLTLITDMLRREGYRVGQSIQLCPKGSFRHHMLEFSQFGISLRIYNESEIKRLLYPLPGFDNALSKKDGPRTDVIAVCAVKDNRIIAAAGASNDSELMWQVGIDVLPEFREMGIGSTLISLITDEITNLGKLPYYGLIPGNIASLNTALACGYAPVFTEFYTL